MPVEASANKPQGAAEAVAIALSRARLAEALTATAGGDRQALSNVHALTSTKLFGICFRVCGDRQAAEDTLHDVYLRVWLNAGSWDPARGSPITWLATIARNRAMDWRRAQRIRRCEPLDRIADIVHDPAIDAESALLSAEANRHLHACLSNLDVAHRTPIREAFFDGASYAELAESRGIPVATMKSRMRRGLARMHAQLVSIHRDDPGTTTQPFEQYPIR